MRRRFFGEAGFGKLFGILRMGILVLVAVLFSVSCDSTGAGVGRGSGSDGSGDTFELREVRFGQSAGALGVSSFQASGEAGGGLAIQDALSEPLDGKTVTSTATYSFSEFRFVADIFLRAATLSDSGTAMYEILSWGGDPDDLTRYIDLVTGKVFDDEQQKEIPQMRFDSITLQINAPGDTIVPDFEGDAWPGMPTTFNWTDVKPFSSTSSSAQRFLLSTYIDTPMVKWIQDNSGQVPAELASIPLIAEYNEMSEEPITCLADWATSSLPLTEEFFNLLKTHEYESDPYSGEAWVFLPLNQAIDFSSVEGDVAVEFDFRLDSMFEVHTITDGSNIPMLSGTKAYTDSDGFVRYSPFPARVSVIELSD